MRNLTVVVESGRSQVGAHSRWWGRFGHWSLQKSLRSREEVVRLLQQLLPDCSGDWSLDWSLTVLWGSNAKGAEKACKRRTLFVADWTGTVPGKSKS
jgi:hypothetical protein